MEPYEQTTELNDFSFALAIAEGLERSLRLARALAGQSRPVDLAGMQDSIGILCAKALDSSEAERRALRIALVALRAELDALSMTMRAAMSD